MSRKRHTREFKIKVAIEAIKEVKTLNEIASDYGVHPTQVSQWKKLIMELSASKAFSKKRQEKKDTKKIDQLHCLIGELTVERDWLKKKLLLSP